MGDEVEVEVDEGEPPTNPLESVQNDDTRSNFDDDLRELKYQYRSFPVRIFLLHVWPRLHYFWLHVIYITTLSIIGGVFIWWIEQDNKYYAKNNRMAPTFIDATLSTVSATTTVGMVTLDFWGLRMSSQVIHLLLAQLGCSSFVAAMTAFIRRKSLSLWLSKHPQRKCNEADNVVLCHKALLRLGITLLLYNLATVIVVWVLLSIYDSIELKTLLKDNAIDPTWFAFFTSVCSFNQTGFALLEDGLIPINNDTFFAILLSLVILFSNTLLPLVMRALISLAARFSKEPEPWKFMLEHPRICSTILFPALQTKILTGMPI
jgi:Trk-type K+ transport system membrane component